jgi:hypothetical protein
MDLTITIPTHIIHKVNMREVILIDILYELGYGFFIGGCGHTLILPQIGKNSKSS